MKAALLKTVATIALALTIGLIAIAALIDQYLERHMK